MSLITQKELYEEAVLKISTDHSHQSKWVIKLGIVIVWEEVWNTIHNILVTNKTKTGEQVHLNFYTQYSYNKWHHTNDMCPLCKNIPQNIYHIILDCPFVNTIWAHIQPILFQFDKNSISDEEKAFGIVRITNTPGLLTRNWLTYKMREEIMNFERMAYHSPHRASISLFKAKFNNSMASEIKRLMNKYNDEYKLHLFDKLVAYRGILCEKLLEGEYRLKPIF